MTGESYISRQCHDLKHQVAALRSACTPDEQETYLRQLEEKIALYNAYCNTGNQILDNLLTQKAIYCSSHGIRLNYEVNGEILADLSVQELCSLFGNLLDNAIEAVEQIPDAERRQILLELFQKAGFRLLRVENTCLQAPVFDTDLPHTSKAEPQNHGYGLKSVQLIAQRYGGSLRCTYQDGWFQVKLLLPKRED